MTDNPVNDNRLHATMDPVPVLPDFADPAQVPAHMVAAAAAALDGKTWSSSEDAARLALSAALPGCAVVPLPTPTEVDAEGVAYWGDVHGGGFVASRPPTDDPSDTLDGVDLGGLLRTIRLTPAYAFTVAGWVLAGAAHAQPAPLTPAPGEPRTDVSTQDNRKLMAVLVRDRSAESPWGSGPVAPRVRSIQIAVTCPVCGGPRGKPRNRNTYDDGAYFSVDVWNNPCGHIDYYAAVIVEARELADRATNSATNDAGAGVESVT